jgi:hypothetical protein
VTLGHDFADIGDADGEHTRVAFGRRVRVGERIQRRNPGAYLMFLLAMFLLIDEYSKGALLEETMEMQAKVQF